MRTLRYSLPCRLTACFVAFVFTFTVLTPGPAYASVGTTSVGTPPLAGFLQLPPPGTMVTTSPAYVPPMLKGLIVHPENPFQFDFIFDSGHAKLSQEEIKEESTTLIKYFLASLTIPEEELWVNLSPYEKDRIIPEEFGQTEMGRDLLAQDYILKQLTASLMFPEDELGERFWNKIYEKAYEVYGTTEIPVNTFNKVWIVPEKAVVYENGDKAFVVESRLKVMLEQDYVALEHADRRGLIHQTQNKGVINPASPAGRRAPTDNPIATNLIREIILPEIEREVNEGKNFAKLRQIYSSHILATWYKQKLQNDVGTGRDLSLLGKEYIDQKKTPGIEVEDKDIKQKIYNQYLAAFKKGAYNLIKEDYDPYTQKLIPRKYFSGGIKVTLLKTPIETTTMGANSSPVGEVFEIKTLQVPHNDNEEKINASPVTDNPLTKLSNIIILTHPLKHRENAIEYQEAARGFDAIIGILDPDDPYQKMPHLNDDSEIIPQESSDGIYKPPENLGDSAVFVGGSCIDCLLTSVAVSAEKAFINHKTFTAYLYAPGIWVNDGGGTLEDFLNHMAKGSQNSNMTDKELYEMMPRRLREMFVFMSLKSGESLKDLPIEIRKGEKNLFSLEGEIKEHRLVVQIVRAEDVLVDADKGGKAVGSPVEDVEYESPTILYNNPGKNMGIEVRISRQRIEELFPGRRMHYNEDILPELEKSMYKTANFLSMISEDLYNHNLWFIFSHLLHNAIDSYRQKYQMLGSQSLKDDLVIKVNINLDKDNLVIRFITNGVSLDIAENTEEKRERKSQGLGRLGGEGYTWKEEIPTLVRQLGRNAGIRLLDRMKVMGDEDGAVVEIRIPRDNFFILTKPWSNPGQSPSADTGGKTGGSLVTERGGHRRAGKVGRALAGLISAATLPFVPLIAAAIKFDSRGPVFYKEDRIIDFDKESGELVTATVIKFRSMQDTTQEDNNPPVIKKDPRITRVGRWLRKTHLDEIPQFWQFARGELDIRLFGVRPRPLSAMEGSLSQKWRQLIMEGKMSFGLIPFPRVKLLNSWVKRKYLDIDPLGLAADILAYEILADKNIFEIFGMVFSSFFNGRSSLDDIFEKLIKDEESKELLRREAAGSPDSPASEDKGGETAGSPIVTQTEIEAAIDWINTFSKRVIFDGEAAKQHITQKILSMRLNKNKSVLVAGPGGLDFLPILLTKLGIKTSVIDVNLLFAKEQRKLHEEYGVDDAIDSFTSYEAMGSQKFDYIFMFAVVNYSLGVSATGTKEVIEIMETIIKHLSFNEGILFINGPEYTWDQEIFPDLNKSIGLLGEKINVRFKMDITVDLDNFSMYPEFSTYFKESRRGMVYVAEKISSPTMQVPDKRAKGGIDLHPNHMDIQRQGVNVSSPINLQNMQDIEINGLTPFIFSITPIKSLPALLGAGEESQEINLSKSN